MAQITGYPIEELYNIKITDLAAPGESCKMMPFNEDHNNAYQINFWGLTKNGERKYFSNIFYNEVNPGKPSYKFIITTDKTNEKIQNELLRSNEMKLKATLESLQKYIIVIDSKGFIINYYKPSSVKHFVFDPALNPVGKHYTDLPLSEDFIERILDTTIKVQNEGKSKTIEVPLQVKNKIRWYYVNISIRYSTTGQNIGWTLVMDDITRIKATEMQLKNREAQLFSLINHFPDIVCLKDNENRWILANKQMLELYGIKNKPYLLKNCREMATMYPENKTLFDKCHDTDIQAWDARSQIKFDVTFDTDQEVPRSFEIIKVPIFDEDDNPNWLIMLGRDITNRNRMNQELKAAKENAEKADQLKTAFLTNMSHELRTPLNGIVGFSQLLKNNLYDQQEHDEFVDIIYDSSNLLLSIINDIIDLSRMETGQINFDIKPVNINELLKEAFSSYRRQYKKKEIQLHLEFPRVPKEIIIDTDKVRLHQVLNNLVANAYKFTKAGRIDIVVDFDDGHKNLIISVSDTGIGIPKQYHNTIFERFRQVEEGYSREYGGAGLGLAISKKLTEVLGGTIKIESELNKGSKFSVVLPYIQKPYEVEPSQKIPDIEFIKNKKVLAVEDDAGSYLLLKSILQNTGCKLIHSKNGKEAIDLLQNDQNIDLVLMDMQMPVMDGLEATRQIKGLNANIPIIAQTAHAFTNDREKCLSAGCDEFITKPIRFNELFSAMYRIMVNGKLEV
jgi:PAS domain S-box-containing protein